MKTTDDFRYAKEAITSTIKSTPFAVNKDEWNTKEDIGKSMKIAHIVVCQDIFWAEVISNSEKIKPLSLAVVELRFSEGISKSVT